MIKEFKITNFFSILETQTISFEISKKDMLDESSFISPCGNMLNSIVAVMGNNASGKTNVLKGLSFLLWFSNASYQALSIGARIPVRKHMLSDNEDSSFEIIFENDGKEYQYKLILNNNEVVYEFLGVKKERGYSYIYEMSRKNGKVVYDKWDLSKLNDADKSRFEQRPNSSLFSFLLNTGHLPAIGIKTISPMLSNISPVGVAVSSPSAFKLLEISKQLEENKDRRELILKYIKSFGLGVDGFKFKRADLKLGENNFNGSNTVLSLNLNALNLVHNAGDKSFELPLLEESEGTLEAIYVLNNIMPALEAGGIIVYDEIESSIHPYLVKKMVKLFANKDTNPKQAQLIFSTHQPWLLDDRTKTQIYLTEKNEKMETEAFRLDEVEGVRNDDNFCNKYLSGAYGGVVDMRWF